MRSKDGTIFWPHIVMTALRELLRIVANFTTEPDGWAEL